MCIKNWGTNIKSDALSIVHIIIYSLKVFFDWISEEGVIDSFLEFHLNIYDHYGEN